MSRIDVDRLKLTPTEEEIYNFLSDGKYHPKEDLHKAVNEFASWETVGRQVRFLRKKLEPFGLSIETATFDSCTRYRLIRQITGYF